MDLFDTIDLSSKRSIRQDLLAVDYYDDDEYDEYWNDPDYETDLEEEDESFHEILAEIRSKTKPIDAKTKDEIIAQGRKFFETFNFFDVSNFKKVPDFIETEAENVYNQEFEYDHTFDDMRAKESYVQAIKPDIQEKINQGVINSNFNANSNECDFLKKEIDLIIEAKINSRNKPFSTTEALRIVSNDYALNNSVFNAGLNKFLKHPPRFTRDINFEKLNHPEDINKIIHFKDENFTIPLKLAQLIRIVYITSGGGKSNLAKNSKRFYEVDQLVEDNYDSFKEFREYCSRMNQMQYMNLWFKYHLAKISPDDLADRILLMNHPNQVPNVFKLRINELIIMPMTFNWKLRFFSENFFSLLFCQNYVKKFVKYENYLSVINTFFRFHYIKERKNFLDKQQTSIISDDPYSLMASTSGQNQEITNFFKVEKRKRKAKTLANYKIKKRKIINRQDKIKFKK